MTSMIIEDICALKNIHSTIDTVDDLIDRLKEKRFNFNDVARCRHIFPRWGLQTILLQRVLRVLHFIEIPNLSEIELTSTVSYLTDNDHSLPEIWSWVSTRESFAQIIKVIVESGQAFSDGEILNADRLWCLNEVSYENIVHSAVRHDNMKLVEVLVSMPCCVQIMQSNYLCQTPGHLAAAEWKLNLVSLLINCPHSDARPLDNNGRSVLGVLLYYCVQKLQRKVRVEMQLLVHLARTILSKVEDRDLASFLLNLDATGRCLLHYAVATGDAQLIHVFLSRHEVVKPEDLGRHLRHAILFNSATVTDALANAYLRSDGSMTKSSTDGLFESDLAAYLCTAIAHNRCRSLLTLLSRQEFIASLNAPQCYSTWIFDESHKPQVYSLEQYPLQAAVDNVKYFANAECLRVLLKFEANVLLRLRDRRELLRNRRSLMFDRPYDAAQSERTYCDWTALYKYVTYESCAAHDNIFSFAAAIVPPEDAVQSLEGIEAGAIDSIRHLLRSKPEVACYVPTACRRIQADEVSWTIILPSSLDETSSIHSSTRNTGSSLDFFMDYALFSCSPIVTAILSSQSLVSRRARRPYKQHSNSTMTSTSSYGCRLLEYLLIHTPFTALVNVQESVSGLTPLAAACVAGSVELIKVLVRLGAKPDTKFNACIISK